MAQDGTYPPLDVLKPVCDGVWVVDSGPQYVLGLPLPVRMVVVRLADGGLWLHSPTRHSGPLAQALRKLGPVRHLVSPGTAHWVHLAGWHQAIPEAKLWAPAQVVARARDQGVELRADGAVEAAPPPDWEGQIGHDVLRGRGFIEYAFHHAASGTLILTDTLQAIEPARLPLLAGFVVRALGAPGPAGGTPHHVRLLLRGAAEANRAAAGRLLALAPRRVIFAHGTWFTEDAPARLRAAWGWMFR